MNEQHAPAAEGLESIAPKLRETIAILTAALASGRLTPSEAAGYEGLASLMAESRDLCEAIYQPGRHVALIKMADANLFSKATARRLLDDGFTKLRPELHDAITRMLRRQGELR